MSYNCKILLDSISETGKRITTFELTYPRIIHSEFMTHRMFSRNAASSRAIPAKRMREMVLNEIFIPERFPKNIAGMQPAEWLKENSSEYIIAKENWQHAAKNAVNSHKALEEVGVHKQICNRLLEPFLWYTCIVTTTEFDNFFKLRCDENAQYEIKRIADLMYEAYHVWDGRHNLNAPNLLKVGEWHCPLVSKEDESLIVNYIESGHDIDLYREWHINTVSDMQIAIQDLKKKISVARCARVSYLTHDGKRDIKKDLELFERLRTSGHWSPFEHVATPNFNKYSIELRQQMVDLFGDKHKILPDTNGYSDLPSGNFLGWKQYRKEFQDENCTSFKKEN